MPSAEIRRNVGLILVRTRKDFLNAATISRKQDIAITKTILSFGQIMLVPQKSGCHDFRALHCRSQHRFCCIALGLLLAQSGHHDTLNQCLLLAQSGHHDTLNQCPLLTQSGHWRLKIAAAQLTPEPYSADRKSLL
jgi:hypothetical protein